MKPLYQNVTTMTDQQILDDCSLNKRDVNRKNMVSLHEDLTTQCFDHDNLKNDKGFYLKIRGGIDYVTLSFHRDCLEKYLMPFDHQRRKAIEVKLEELAEERCG